MTRERTLAFEETATGQPLTVRLYESVEGSTRAVVCVVHGMAEHSTRYLPLARHLTQEGFTTALFDLPGHGAPAAAARKLGHFADKDGETKVLQDLLTLIQRVQSETGDKPLILLGHSMGSMLVRRLALDQSLKLAGIVLSGTMGPNPATALGHALAALTALFRGPEYRSPMLDRLSSRPNREGLADDDPDFAWLSRDREEVKRYTLDPLCGFLFSAAAWRDLTAWLTTISKTENVRRLPADIPYYLFSGDRDPVGGMGEGPRWLARILAESGHKVTLQLYAGGRHEMLNETNRAEVLDQLTTALLAMVPAPPSGGGNLHGHDQRHSP